MSLAKQENESEICSNLYIIKHDALTFPFFFHSYMVDAADHEKIEASKTELHLLLDKPQLNGIPVRDRY